MTGIRAEAATGIEEQCSGFCFMKGAGRNLCE